MSAVVEKVLPNGQPDPAEPKQKAVTPSDQQAFQAAAENPDETAEGDGLSELGELPLKLSVKAATGGDDEDTEPKPKFDLNEDTYDGKLNSIVANMVDSVEGRSLQGITRGDNAKNYQYMIEYKLHEQAKNGENVSLDKAYQEVEDAIRGRYGLAAENYDDKDHRLDVLDGYWEDQKGRVQAKDLAVGAYQNYWNDYGPSSADKGSYDDKLNALASGMIGGVIEKHHRTLAIALNNNDKVKDLYKNLVKDKLADQGAPFNLDRAHREVMEDLRARMKTAAGNTEADAGKLTDVMDGYWEDQTGEADAKSLARTAYEEYEEDYEPTEEDSTQIDGGSKYDNELNAVAATLADGVDPDTGRVKHFTDSDVRDHYGNLVYLKLQEQKEAGEGISLDKAYDEVKDDVYSRLDHALRDHDDAGGAKDAYNDYWDDGDGKGDAGKVARDAYGKFLQENTLLDNPDYDDNLNALVTSMGDGVINDTRTLSGLRGGVPKELYKNVITHKLDEGKSLDEATEEVISELEARVKAAYSGDAEDIVLGYFSRRDGKDAAKDGASEAYAEYVGSGGKPSEPGSSGSSDSDADWKDKDEDDLLPPFATDIMNAKTVDGDTVTSAFLKNIIEEYEDSDKDYEREFAELAKMKAALNGDQVVLPSYTVNTANGDRTDYASNTTTLDAGIMAGLADEEAVDAAIAKLVGEHSSLATDQEKFLKQAVMRIEDKKTLTDRIYDTMTSPIYQQQLLEMGTKGDSDSGISGQERFAADYRSLQLLDPELADKAKDYLVGSGAVDLLEGQLEGGTQNLDPEAVGLSAQDAAYAAVRGTVLGLYQLQNTIGLRGFFDDTTKLDALKNADGSNLSEKQKGKLQEGKAAYKTLSELYKEAILDPKNRNNPNWWKNVLDATSNEGRINAAITGANVDPKYRDGVKSVLRDMNSKGIIGTGAGLACLAAATMGLTMDGGYETKTWQERTGSAFYLLWTLSSTPEAINAVGGTLEKILKKPGMMAAIGMDKTPGSLFKDVEDPNNHRGVFEATREEVRTTGGNQAVDDFNRLGEKGKQEFLKNIDRKLGNLKNNYSTMDKIKLFGPGAKIIGNMGYGAGAVLGIVLGIDAVKSAKTPLDKAQAAMGLGAGIAWAGGAVADAAVLFGAGVGASVASAVLGGLALGMAFVGFGIGMWKQEAENEKKQEEVREQFQQWAKTGLLEDDWGHKLNYALHMMYVYESKPDPKNPTKEWYDYYFPKDQLPWEAQPGHYKRFVELIEYDGYLPHSFFSPKYGPLLEGHGEEPDVDMYG